MNVAEDVPRLPPLLSPRVQRTVFVEPAVATMYAHVSTRLPPESARTVVRKPLHRRIGIVARLLGRGIVLLDDAPLPLHGFPHSIS